MNVVLTMSLSGGCMFIMYFIISKAGANFLTPGAKYILLRITLIYFLAPLSNVKSFYLGILHNVFGWESYVDRDIHIEETKAVFVGDDSLLVNDTFGYMLFVFIVWLSVASVILAFRIIGLQMEIRRIHKNSRCLEDPQILKRLEELRHEYGIRRKVTIYICRLDNIVSMTYGIWKPEIVIPEKVTGNAVELVIRHELVHIKRFDSLIRILIKFADSFHWFNPLIYCLRSQLDIQCEFSCDEIAIRNMDEGQRYLFAKTIVEQARDGSDEKGRPEERLVLGLTGGGKLIKERIECIMEKKEKGSRSHAVRMTIVIAATVLLNSLTVFAYDEVNQVSTKQESQGMQFDLSDMLESENVHYSGSEFSYKSEVIYDEQFTDEEGNVFPAEGVVQQRSICTHTYHPGHIEAHNKASDGSCTVKVYSAERCGGCGLIVVIEYLYTITFSRCPH